MNKEEKEVAGAELLEELGSKNQELELKDQELKLKDQELTKICSQLTVREEELAAAAAAAAAAAPPADSSAEVRATEMEQYRATMGEGAALAEARTQGQAAIQQERARWWGSGRCSGKSWKLRLHRSARRVKRAEGTVVGGLQSPSLGPASSLTLPKEATGAAASPPPHRAP